MRRSPDAHLPVGLFDSGVGGLTVLDAMRRRMPEENFLYLGDTARLPYGTKSRETITRYALQATGKLVERRIKLLVVACNTATAAALPALVEHYPSIPVVGVVEPGARAACRASPSGRIAVMATASTTRGGVYVRVILSHRPNAQVTSLAAPLLVPMAEEGWFEGPLVEGIIAKYLDPVFRGRGDDPDCLVLGCTHFPLLLKALRAVVGPAVSLVDSADTTAEEVLRHLDRDDLENTGGGAITFLTTDDTARFAATGSIFLGMPIDQSDVELVNL
ncbi:MAG: glutamate racemase [Deltaproteobacteria bacterium]|jgi:glutamate racemase|nr:glutamate racemase [Deltaproteobacteria bacterium]